MACPFLLLKELPKELQLPKKGLKEQLPKKERAAKERADAEERAAERAAAAEERAAERARELICYFIVILSLNVQLNCESTDNLELERIKRSRNLKSSAGNNSLVLPVCCLSTDGFLLDFSVRLEN